MSGLPPRGAGYTGAAKPQPKIKSEANSTAATIFGLVFVVCASVCMIMLTVAFGIYLFG